MKAIVTPSVGGTSTATAQHCGLGLLTIAEEKSMGQGKKTENMFTQEAVWEL